MRWLVLSFLFFLPSVVLAVQINEIMYDLPGSDSGREWVEVWQEGGDCVNLSGWKFFEANTSHGLTFVQGNGQLCFGEYAVIADNSDKFLLDHIDFSGSLFESAFSLSNTGELLALKDPDGNITDSVTYSGSWGANGTGKTLERNSSGWFESLVNGTPGKINSIVIAVQNQSAGQTAPQNRTPQPVIRVPVITLSMVSHSNRVPPGSVIEAVLSVSSDYDVERPVFVCMYARLGNASAADAACKNITLAPNSTKEVRLYSTLKPALAGNLTLSTELDDGFAVRKAGTWLDVVKPARKAVSGPTPAFVAKKSVLSDWLEKLSSFFSRVI